MCPRDLKERTRVLRAAVLSPQPGLTVTPAEEVMAFLQGVTIRKETSSTTWAVDMPQTQECRRRGKCVWRQTALCCARRQAGVPGGEGGHGGDEKGRQGRLAADNMLFLVTRDTAPVRKPRA